GDLLFPTLNPPEVLVEQSEVQAEYLLRASDLTHLDAAVPGEKDFALGFKVFEKLRKKTKVKFLAANLVKKSGGGAYLEPHALFTLKDKDGKSFRVGVIGIVGSDLPWPKELRASSPIAAAKKEAQALRKKVDVLVALTHEGLDQDKELAKAVPAFDVIIGGHSQSFLQEPVKIGKTIIYQSSFRNQYVGSLPLAAKFDGAGYQLVGLDAGYDSPAESPSKVDLLVKEFKTSIAELNTQRSLEESAKSDSAAASKDGPKFQTFPRCAECHQKQFDFWRKTDHARALHPLIEAHQERNKECLLCHTVGLGDKQGFSDITKLAEIKGADDKLIPLSTEELGRYLDSVHETKSFLDKVKLTAQDAEPAPIIQTVNRIHRAWTPVQCENCHQPGRDHPFSGKYTKTVEKTVCLNCHTAERAPAWYTKDGQPDWEKIAAKRTMITCPAGEFSDE
ncbi:MAG: multiheme c-type cytochrome, partial [Bdellovibrionota bacterium]